MIKSLKIRLLPTKEQEQMMFKTINCSRFAYNWALNRCNELYKQGEKYSINNIKKEFTQLKKQEEYKWLNEVSSRTLHESIMNLDKSFKLFFKKKTNYPNFKSKKKSKQSFYVRYDRLYFKNDMCNIEKIGKIKYKTKHIIPNCKYSNPYCSFDGKYWYLSFGIEFSENQIELNKDLSIGIDLGIKDLAICSNGMIFKNINKTKEVRRLKKKLKRLQRQVSKKYEMNKQGNKFVKTNNIVKLEKEIKLVYRKLSNIRLNHIHQSTNKIIKTRPYRVVMEDLNISGMMKNKHLSKSIQEQCFYEFIRQMKYKCEFNGIEFIQVDRFYPSSKTCSECGHVIDRDLNASINLSRYGLV